MYEHDVFECFLVQYLYEECIFISSLCFQLNNMTINMVNVLVIQLLVELALELSCVLLRLQLLFSELFFGVHWLGFHVEQRLFLHG